MYKISIFNKKWNVFLCINAQIHVYYDASVTLRNVLFSVLVCMTSFSTVLRVFNTMGVCPSGNPLYMFYYVYIDILLLASGEINILCLSLFWLTGLLSPGLSVPLQVPAGAATHAPPPFNDYSSTQMNSMTSHYWPRICWRHQPRERSPEIRRTSDDTEAYGPHAVAVRADAQNPRTRS